MITNPPDQRVRLDHDRRRRARPWTSRRVRLLSLLIPIVAAVVTGRAIIRILPAPTTGAGAPGPWGCADSRHPSAIDVAANDRDAEGGMLTVVAVSAPGHGSAVVNTSETVTYTPGAGFAGIDSFSYEVCDPAGMCATGVVTVTVP